MTEPVPDPRTDALLEAVLDAIDREPWELRKPMLAALKAQEASVKRDVNGRLIVDFRPAGIDRLVIAVFPRPAPLN